MFVDLIRETVTVPGPAWRFDAAYWAELLDLKATTA